MYRLHGLSRKLPSPPLYKNDHRHVFVLLFLLQQGCRMREKRVLGLRGPLSFCIRPVSPPECRVRGSPSCAIPTVEYDSRSGDGKHDLRLRCDTKAWIYIHGRTSPQLRVILRTSAHFAECSPSRNTMWDLAETKIASARITDITPSLSFCTSPVLPSECRVRRSLLQTIHICEYDDLIRYGVQHTRLQCNPQALIYVHGRRSTQRPASS